jgi:beta-glucosidase
MNHRTAQALAATAILAADDTIRSVAVIGPGAVSPPAPGGNNAAFNRVSASALADALTEALAGLATVAVQPGDVTWSVVPEPPPATLSDPDTGEQGIRLEYRTEDGRRAGTEHRSTTTVTWWDGLPGGISWGGRGTITLRTRYRVRPGQAGPHVIGAGGVGRLTLKVNGIEVAAGHPDVPVGPGEAAAVPGEIRATVYLAEGQEAEIGIWLLPDEWPQGPAVIRLGIAPAPDRNAMLREAVEAARNADAAVVLVGSGPAESHGFALPGRQDELVRRISEVNDRTVVVRAARRGEMHPSLRVKSS